MGMWECECLLLASRVCFWLVAEHALKAALLSLHDMTDTHCYLRRQIASTPLDIARFHFDLQGGRIVSNASLQVRCLVHGNRFGIKMRSSQLLFFVLHLVTNAIFPLQYMNDFFGVFLENNRSAKDTFQYGYGLYPDVPAMGAADPVRLLNTSCSQR